VCESVSQSRYKKLLGVIKKIIIFCDKIISKDPMLASGDVVSYQMTITKRRVVYLLCGFCFLYSTQIFRVYDLSMPDFFHTPQTKNLKKVSFIDNNRTRANITALLWQHSFVYHI
jgi:hypothetical protein